MATLQSRQTKGSLELNASGDWDTQSIAGVDKTLRQVNLAQWPRIIFQTQNIKDLDTAGAWIIYRFLSHCRAQHIRVETPSLHTVLEDLFQKFPKEATVTAQRPDKINILVESLMTLGVRTCAALETAAQLLSFLGECVVRLVRAIFRGRFQFKQMCAHIDYVGIQALPIVGIISFLIGIVLIYQAVFQFRRFGAEIFAVDMLAIALAREIGILLTAIIVAGRSGSAFTAQIGSMKLNQEIDALRVLGIHPLDVLVIPRITALMVALPLLNFYALVMGLIGGAVMCYITLNMEFVQYLHQLHQSLTLHSFMVGLIKAPFFAFIIALVGCFEGMCVSGGASNLGKRTTRAVVEGIFLVIVFNALFSVAFTYMGI